MIGTVACQLALGLEERSERRLGAEASTTDDAGDVMPPPRPGCPLGRTPCGESCVDLQTNDAHCGTCGHDCLGAKCGLGECVAQQLASSAQGQVVAVDDVEIFYRPSPDAIVVAPLVARNKKTGAERNLGNIGRWHHAVVDGDDLVIAENPSTPRIRRVNRTTGASTTLYSQATAEPTFQQIAVEGDDVYWTTRSDVRRVKRDGTGYTTLKTVTEAPFGALGVAVSPSTLFFTVNTRSEVYAMPRDGGASAVVAAGGGDCTLARRLGAAVHVTCGPEVVSMPDVGDAGVAKAGFLTPHSVAAKDRFVYVYDVRFGVAAGSRILRYDVETGSVLVLASVLMPGRLVVDDTHVYFSFYEGGLYRTAR